MHQILPAFKGVGQTLIRPVIAKHSVVPPAESTLSRHAVPFPQAYLGGIVDAGNRKLVFHFHAVAGKRCRLSLCIALDDRTLNKHAPDVIPLPQRSIDDDHITERILFQNIMKKHTGRIIQKTQKRTQ